jgi:hypothetical protein
MDEKLLYLFMESVRGNWRNSIYVVCGTAACKRYTDCSGFLLAFNSSGQPVIMPVDYLEKAGDFTLDKSECGVTISKTAFNAISCVII